MGFIAWLTGRGPLVPEIAAVRVWEENGRLDQNTTVQSAQITEAWQVWRNVGEIHYVTTQQARLSSRLDWQMVVSDEELEYEEAEDTLKAAYGNSMRDLVRRMALHLQVAGAFFLIRNRSSREWDVVTWPAGYNVRKKLEDADIVVEITQEDPADPKLTDSPVLAAIPVARELILSRQQARVAARNRTAQLNTVIYPKDGAGVNADEFERKLARVITEPLSDEMSAASVVPNIIGFQGDKIEQWRTLDLTGPIDEKLHERVERLINQLAVILDIPREIMTGFGEVNHWGTWAISEDNFLGHIEPMAKLIGQALALGLAHAADVDADLIEIDPDPAPLLKRRPALADVIAAYELRLVSAEWTRRQLGAGEEDAPDAAEEEEEDEEEPIGNVGVDEVAVQEPDEPQAASLGRVLEFSRTIKALTARKERLPEVAATAPFSTERLAGIDQQAFDATQDLIDMIGTRVAEKLGSQLRSRLQGDPEAKKAIADVPNVELPVKLGVGILPNAEQTIVDASTTPLADGLSKIIQRAVGYTRSAGVQIELDDTAIRSATDLLISGFGLIMSAWLQGAATDALMWRLSRRVIAIAGGGSDPAPQTAAPGVGEGETPLAGIALGIEALLFIRDTFGLEPDRYEWQHNTITDSHPVHKELNGRVYDGQTIPTATYQAYIGDHAGCRCAAVPRWREYSVSEIIGAPPEGIEIR